jgi:signal transduction histidine kinase
MIDQIASPLTVIRGCSQLWQRRIRRGEDLDREQLFQALATIEQSGRKIGLLLRALEGDHHKT